MKKTPQSVHRPRKSNSQGSCRKIDPYYEIIGKGKQIEEALDPTKAPGKVRQFTPEEIADMNKKLSKT